MKKKIISRKELAKQDFLSGSSKIRMQIFARDVTPELEEVMKSGAVPLANPDKHEFRENSLCPNIYVRRYVKPSKSKDNTFQKTQAGFKAKTEKSEYSGLLRRPFSPKKEISKERFAASALRVQRNASENNCYTLEPSNRFEYINPKYRKVNKAKWVGKVIATQHDFFRFAKEMCKDDSSWKITDISSKEPYIDGFEVTGNLSRKREKNKELQSDFCASFARDTWNKNFPRPISNSTYFSVLKSKSLIKSSKLYPKSFEASKNSLIQ